MHTLYCMKYKHNTIMKPEVLFHTPYSVLHTTGHFRVKSAGRHGVYKLQNVAQPECYLGYVKGYIVGYVSASCCYGDEHVCINCVVTMTTITVSGNVYY